MMSDELEVLSGATRMLAEVHDAASAWKLVATAEGARRYARMRDLGTEASNLALHEPRCRSLLPARR